MKQIWVIATNTFKEAIRNKILYGFVFFAIVMMFGSLVLSDMALAADSKVVTDLGLASIAIFGIFIAIFVGINLVYKEIEKKTIYTIISKPIARYQFVIGKYVGLLLMLFVQIALMTIVLSAVIFSNDGTINPNIYTAIIMTYFELMIITAISIFFSAYSSPFLSSMFTISAYIIGHVTTDLLYYGSKAKFIGLKIISIVAYYVFPNLEKFNIRSRVVHNIDIPFMELFYSVLYSFFWVALLIVGAILLFQKRDFK
ncbi:MAG: ABC transporter permease subunit [Pseudomonadota bacterium]